MKIWNALGLLLCAVGTAHAQAKFSFNSTPGQLPKTVVPTHYALTLTPNPQTLKFTGTETVDVNVLTPTKTITMNQLGLTVVQAGLVGIKAQKRFVPSVKTDDAAQTLTLTFSQTIAPGEYNITLDYSGTVGQQSQGLFAVKYLTPTGKPKLMFGTQMEPTDARRMFPGWDEPAFKARYQLSAIVPKAFMAVSNTPITGEKLLASGLKMVSFGLTPPMSSYLVVLCAGEFEAYTGQAAGVKLRVITTEGKKAQGAYAMSVMEKILPYYNQYFGVKYPLPKLDLIAVPGGFGGAMENWGGITYNENLILFDPKISAEITKRTIFNVVSHETAHQWSGDLVTMAWWDNLWLNEGFASWMADKASDHFNPQWHVLDVAVSQKDDILDSDSYTTTHPIQQAVTDPAQAAAAFDEITYQKGEAVIRMFENYLGPEAFEAGIQKYMRAHQYSNSTTADLWAALGQSSGKPMAAIAAGWTEQPGFPIVIAAPAPGGIALTQQRFTVDTSTPAPEFWQVPIAYMPQAIAAPAQTQATLLTQSGLTLHQTSQGALLLNAGDKGFYRVQYAPALFSPLAAHVESLPTADRIGLLGDTWALAKDGRVPVSSYLELANNARADTDLSVQRQNITTLEEINTLERGQPGQAAFETYLQGVFVPQFAQIGWDAKPGESSDTPILRAGFLSVLGTLGDPAVIAEARKRFAAYVKDQNSLPANLIGPTLIIVAHYADQPTYDQLLKLAQDATDYRQKVRYYTALVRASDPKLAQETLQLALSPQLAATTPEAGMQLTLGVASSGEHPDMALTFFQAHKDALLANQDALTKVFAVPELYSAFSDDAHADALLAYAKANLPPDAAPQIAKIVSQIRTTAALKARLLPDVDKWTAVHGQAVSAK